MVYEISITFFQQIAVCCSREQIHNFEFVRERPVEQLIDLDSNNDSSSGEVLPQIGKLLLFKFHVFIRMN